MTSAPPRTDRRYLASAALLGLVWFAWLSAVLWLGARTGWGRWMTHQAPALMAVGLLHEGFRLTWFECGVLFVLISVGLAAMCRPWIVAPDSWRQRLTLVAILPSVGAIAMIGVACMQPAQHGLR